MLALSGALVGGSVQPSLAVTSGGHWLVLRMGGIMKALLGGFAAMMALVQLGGASHAIDVRNEDERRYQVTITSSSMTRDIDLNALTLSLVVCVGECEFYVPGVGRAKARGNDTVTIRNGKLVHEPRPTSR